MIVPVAQRTEISRPSDQPTSRAFPDADPDSDDEQSVALKRLEDTGGARLLVSDTRVALLLLNEARYRTMQRLFGVSRDQVNLTTAIAALVLAGAVRDRMDRILNAPSFPSATDVTFGAGVLRELVYGAAGPWSRDTPFFGTLVTIAVLGGLARPAAGTSVRNISAASQRMRRLFDGRYGHVLRPHRTR